MIYFVITLDASLNFIESHKSASRINTCSIFFVIIIFIHESGSHKILIIIVRKFYGLTTIVPLWKLLRFKNHCSMILLTYSILVKNVLH